MPARISLKRLKISYLGSVTVIALLLFVSQLLIQFVLHQEVHERNVASQINAQELRTQRMFYNVLLLQNPVGNGVDYMAIYQLVRTDEITWETVQNAMYAPNLALDLGPSDFSSTAIAIATKEQPGFLKMEEEYRHIFAQEQLDHPASPDIVRPDVGKIYLAESPYLQSLVVIYNDLTGKADDELTRIQLMEICLFSLSFLTIFFEYLFVVRPGMKGVKESFGLLQKTVIDVEKEIEEEKRKN